MQDALCAVKLDAGTHTIKLKYEPAGFKASVLITFAGLASLAAVTFVSGKLNKKRALKAEAATVEEAVAGVPADAISEQSSKAPIVPKQDNKDELS